MGSFGSGPPARAQILLDEVYKTDGSPLGAAQRTVGGGAICLDAIRNLTPVQQRAAVAEIEAYFSGTYPCLDGDVFAWWMVGSFNHVIYRTSRH